MPTRRGPAADEGFPRAGEEETELQPLSRTRRPGVRVSFQGGLVPRSVWGRIAAGGGLLVLIGGAVAAVLALRSFLLHDPHFVIESSSSVEIAGNSHLSRAQLLSVFGGDVERNIFRIPLEDRRAELESLPWVQHATVMRLLPARVRVSIAERTPVAFVRQGRQIGLVDGDGVLLDFGPGEAEGGAAAKYSFPVVLGISESDPLSTRAARMRIYKEFLAALDAGGEKLSQTLSEVDLSEPEDVRATLPDGSGGELLVHFGEEKYLERYHRYQEHLAEWKQQYPHLASVDLRYEQQAVLQMQPGTAADTGPVAGTGSPAKDGSAGDVKPEGSGASPVVRTGRTASKRTPAPTRLYATAVTAGQHVAARHAASTTRKTGKAPGEITGAGTAR